MSAPTDIELVDLLYRRVLRRRPHADELAAFARRLGAGESREAIVMAFLNSSEASRASEGGEFVHAGHFYSAVPSKETRRKHEQNAKPASLVASLPGIDCRDDAQLAWIERFETIYAERPFSSAPTPGLRYHYENPAFGYGDGTTLYSMLRLIRPKRVVEVGSGFSSSLMLDVAERFLQHSVEFTFIEPYPALLKSLMRDEDRKRHTIIEQPVQEVSPDLASQLEAGDILFIDSTHVSKLGSDVNWLYFEWLPRVAKGVYIHIHDIFWPFEYPTRWVAEGRAWNELYLLRAMLQESTTFAIEFFNHYLSQRHRDVLARKLPDYGKNVGGSIWLSRT